MAETCCQVFNFADLLHVVSLAVINCGVRLLLKDEFTFGPSYLAGSSNVISSYLNETVSYSRKSAT